MELGGNSQSTSDDVAQNLCKRKQDIKAECEGPDDLSEEEFPSPPPLNSISHQGCSSFEGKPTDGAEVLLDPTQVIAPQSTHSVQEWPNMADRTDPDNQDLKAFCDEVMASEATLDEDTLEMELQAENFGFSQTHDGYVDGTILNQDEINSVYVYQQQLDNQDICNHNLQHSQDLSSQTLHVCPSVQQQEEQLSQSQDELVPRGENQETARQVFGHGSPPLSNVAMELSNQGGASYSSGCVVALREGHGKAEGRTEEESVQTGGKTGQGEGGVEKKEPTTQKEEGLLSYSQTENYRCGVAHEKESHTSMGNDSWDKSQSDSGISTDFSSFSSVEGSTCTSTDMTADISKETPIEMEIRRAIEREHSLRRARGLPTPPTGPLYVEIPLRTNGPGSTLAGKAGSNPEKDRELAGKMMQHEIHGEIQREQDLVKLGKVPGVYDKGTVRQLKERKLIFEAFQTPSESTCSVSTKSNGSSWSSGSEVSTPKNTGDLPSQATSVDGPSPGREQSQNPLSPTHSNSAKGRGLSRSSRRGPGFSEGTSFQVVILENDLSVPAQKCYQEKSKAEPKTTVNSENTYIASFREEEEENEEPKENPFFKLRSSDTFIKVKQDIQETEEREKELRHQRISLYGRIRGTDGKQSPVHKEENTSTSPSSSINKPNLSDTPRLSFSGGPITAQHSVGTSSLRLPANTEERRTAGPEIMQSSFNPRQKTPLVQRWESGLLNGHNKDDE